MYVPQLLHIWMSRLISVSKSSSVIKIEFFIVTIIHTYPDVYKVASKIIGLTQFWAADIPLSIRHKRKHSHPLVYPGGPDVGFAVCSV